jgi:hypothetical protein
MTLVLISLSPFLILALYPVPALVLFAGLALVCYRLFPDQKTFKHYVLMAAATWLLATMASILLIFAFQIPIGH